jgi:long-chain acyl-CoA synthetase
MTVSASNLVELGARAVAQFGDRPAFGTRTPQGFEWLSYADWGRAVDACRGGLATLGIGAGDRVAIVADNCVEWAVVAYATYGRGAALVPLYEAQRPEEWAYILADSGARVVFAGRPAIAEQLRAQQAELAALEQVFALGTGPTDLPRYDALLERGRQSPAPSVSPEPGDVAGVIYTSGTTGNPKGVLLSHANFCANVAAIHQLFAVDGDTTLSFLPWAHVFGQTADLHVMIAGGTAIALNDEVTRLIDNLALVRPTLLVAVPRIFNRVHDRVQQAVAERPLPIRALFRAGVRAAQKRRAGQPVSWTERLALAGADALVFRKTRRRLGGRLRFAVSGSAALGREVAEFIGAIGLDVYEGYGLTETAPVVSVNAPGRARPGSVGRPLPGVRVEIDRSRLPETEAEDDPRIGEIVVHGPNVMLGYHAAPEATRERLRPDGGCRTGDLGYLDEDGFLHITGRITEQFKLENGKFVVPSPLEEDLKLSPYVANALIFGLNRPHTVALVVLDVPAVQRWARDQGLALDDPTGHPAVRDLIAAELARRATGWRSFERPRGFHLVTEDFTTENGLLTPSLKVRRERALAKYADDLAALYASPA